MALPLLATKLHRPDPGSGLIPRSRLMEALDRGRRGPLTLVSAPAGFGKTTLVARWLQERDPPGGWVSVDPSDADPPRFWSYLVAALDGVQGVSTERAEAILQAPEPDIPSVVATLVNELARSPAVGAAGEDGAEEGGGRPAVLVLDDLHAVDTPAIHEALTLFLDHLPPSLHVVVVTRVDPPLPLARYRARGDLTEIRQSRLRFSPQEVEAYLNGLRKLELDPRALEALEARTEGWAASLQLAALSLNRLDPAEQRRFVQDFTGDDRYVMDFLVDEVLALQPEAVQRFLLATSVLDRMTEGLCRALLEVAGWPEGEPVPSLARLERRGLFVVPLDTRREWYRYHHLFGELLRIRSRAELDREALLGAASRWFEEEGRFEEAVDYALRAGDDERAASVLSDHFPTLIGLGQTRLVRRFVEALPRERVWNSISLCMAMAYCARLHTLPEEAERWWERADHLLTESEPTAERREEQSAHLALLRGFGDEARQDGDEAHEAYGEARDRFSALDYGYLLAVAEQGLTGTLLARERLDEAEAYGRRAVERGFQEGNLLAGTTGFARLGLVLTARGRLAEVEAAGRTHLERLREAAGDRVALLEPYPRTRRAEALIRMDRLDEAEALLEAAETVTRQGNNPTPLALVLLGRMRLALARDRPEQGVDPSRELHALLEGDRVLLFPLERLHEILRVRLWLASGETGRAREWLQAREARHGDTGEALPTLTRIARARVVLAGGDDSRLRAEARAMADAARTADGIGAGGWALEARVVEARILDRLRDGGAPRVLARALRAASEQGERRAFLDEGPELSDLLSRARAGAGDVAPGELVAELQGRLRSRGTSPRDLLSDRELEVLQLLDTGMSNREVADRLFVTEGTIKKHTHNIYQKLQVSRRSEALAEARERSIL